MSGTERPTRECLVVDDSRVVRRIARRALETAGLAVREAADGEAALASCRDRLPDSVLLDWNMPVMNGIEFLRSFRREFGADGPPVIFCTTETEWSFIDEAIGNGAQEYVMKPFDDDILLGKFARLGLL